MKIVEAHGARIPALGLGTWTLKGEDCVRLVDAALGAGYRHLDTAAMYGNEKEVGEGLRRSDVARDQVFVTTKVWWADIGSADLRRSAEKSLSALGLDQVDLFLIHWPNPAVPLEESIEALNRLHRDGLARHIGVSNFTTGLLARALDLSESPLVANQVEYHPYLDQSKVHAACRAAGMAMVSYSPIYRGGELFSEDAVQSAAIRHRKSPAQIVLRWHVQQDGVVAIPRTTKVERLRENIDIFDFALSEDEMAAVSGLGRRHVRLCDYDFSPDWDPA